jgi:hypothetical protein
VSPPGVATYVRDLADGLAKAPTPEAAAELRAVLAARHDIEVLGPPPA